MPPPALGTWHAERSHRQSVSRGFQDSVEWRGQRVRAAHHHRLAKVSRHHGIVVDKNTVIVFPVPDSPPWTRGTTEDEPARFSRLSEMWKSETCFLSSPEAMAIHNSYQEIIGMGAPAVPLILEDLRRRPGQWFWALRAIVGYDAARGATTIQGAADAWITWGIEKGIIPLEPNE